MNATDTRSQLLAEVAANPEDDTLRLAFADWLDEQRRVEFCVTGLLSHGDLPRPSALRPRQRRQTGATSSACRC